MEIGGEETLKERYTQELEDAKGLLSHCESEYNTCMEEIKDLEDEHKEEKEAEANESKLQTIQRNHRKIQRRSKSFVRNIEIQKKEIRKFQEKLASIREEETPLQYARFIEYKLEMKEQNTQRDADMKKLEDSFGRLQEEVRKLSESRSEDKKKMAVLETELREMRKDLKRGKVELGGRKPPTSMSHFRGKDKEDAVSWMASFESHIRPYDMSTRDIFSHLVAHLDGSALMHYHTWEKQTREKRGISYKEAFLKVFDPLDEDQSYQQAEDLRQRKGQSVQSYSIAKGHAWEKVSLHDPRKRVYSFVRGLEPTLRKAVRSQMFPRIEEDDVFSLAIRLQNVQDGKDEIDHEGRLGKKSNWRVRKRGEGRPRQRGDKITCFACGKVGHYANVCRTKEEDREKYRDEVRKEREKKETTGRKPRSWSKNYSTNSVTFDVNEEEQDFPREQGN